MSRWRALPLPFAAAGCAGVQAMDGGAGSGSAQFNHLMIAFLVVCAVAFIFVLLFLLFALLRRGEGESRSMRAGLIGWVAFIVIGLVGLTLATFLSDRHSAAIAAGEPPLRITLTGNQWWWQVDYHDPVPSRGL